MKFSYLVRVGDKKIGVSDDQYGDERMAQIYRKYGDCIVEVRDYNTVFGKGLEEGEPIYRTTITKLYE